MTKENIKSFVQSITQINEWLAMYAANSPKTKERYSRDITNFCTACKIKTYEELISINSIVLEKFYNWAREKDWTNNGINLVIQTLKTFFKFLNINYNVQNKTISTLKKLPNDSKPQRCLSEDEMNLLLTTIKKCSTKKKYYALFLLYFEGGLRFSELTNLKIEDIGKNYVRIVGKGSKIREQLIPLTVLDVINDYINTERKNVAQEFERRYNCETPYVFLADFNGKVDGNQKNYQRISNASLNNSIKSFARKAGITDWKRLHIHSCRHSYATMINMRSGGNIRLTQQLMRHSDIRTTQRYITIYTEQMSDIINSLDLEK